MTTKGCVSGQGPETTKIQKYISSSTGNYASGLKDGIWKFYRRGNKFYKQVTYKFGRIQKVEIIHSNGKWQFVATVNDKLQNAHYISYDPSGEIAKEGDFPVMLLYSNSMDLH
jgi:antitoxin component YwqK of YwqJK toxin-antitoxin module